MGLVYRGPADPAPPVPMSGWLSRELIVQGARRNNHLLTAARRTRYWAVAARANSGRKAFRLRKIVPRNQFLPRNPAKLIGIDRDISRSHAARGLPAAGAIAVGKPEERRPYLIADRFAKATPSKRLIGHRHLLVARLVNRRYLNAPSRSNSRKARRSTKSSNLLDLAPGSLLSSSNTV